MPARNKWEISRSAHFHNGLYSGLRRRTVKQVFLKPITVIQIGQVMSRPRQRSWRAKSVKEYVLQPSSTTKWSLSIILASELLMASGSRPRSFTICSGHRNMKAEVVSSLFSPSCLHHFFSYFPHPQPSNYKMGGQQASRCFPLPTSKKWKLPFLTHKINDDPCVPRTPASPTMYGPSLRWHFNTITNTLSTCRRREIDAVPLNAEGRCSSYLSEQPTLFQGVDPASGP